MGHSAIISGLLLRPYQNVFIPWNSTELFHIPRSGTMDTSKSLECNDPPSYKSLLP